LNPDLALGADLQGHKDLLGIWVEDNEGAKFWLCCVLSHYGCIEIMDDAD